MTPDMQLCVAMRLFSAQVERKCLLERFWIRMEFINVYLLIVRAQGRLHNL